mmetsp:Transcript_20713/g.34179  ORF Transcript_20713/g.34179 Transcript_20713/m.34179 type:complete len:455 (+) Transcript_20713:59-1423(+)
MKNISNKVSSEILDYLQAVHGKYGSERCFELSLTLIRCGWIVPLMWTMQKLARIAPDFDQVEADSENEEEAKDVISAQSLLSFIYTLALERLQEGGWSVVRHGEKAGSLVFKHKDLPGTTEFPKCDGQRWEHDIAQAIGTFIVPEVLDNQMVWSTTVIDDTGIEESEQKSTVRFMEDAYCTGRWDEKDLSESKALNRASVFDVIQVDKSKRVIFVRELVQGVWRGPQCHSSYSEKVDTTKLLCEAVDNWLDQTLCGLSLIALQKAETCKKALFVDCGLCIAGSFIKSHLKDVDIHVVDRLQAVNDARQQFFGGLPGPVSSLGDYFEKNETMYDVIICAAPSDMPLLSQHLTDSGVLLCGNTTTTSDSPISGTIYTFTGNKQCVLMQSSCPKHTFSKDIWASSTTSLAVPYTPDTVEVTGTNKYEISWKRCNVNAVTFAKSDDPTYELFDQEEGY